MTYRRFISSSRWQRLRAYHLKHHPLCHAAKHKGVTVASEVHHVLPCGDDPALQTDPLNLESLCRECHQPLKDDDRRGYSREIDSDGYFVDERHPSNRTRSRNKRNKDKTQNTGGEGKT